jgi:transcriptional regulator with XRE-family HTH domain
LADRKRFEKVVAQPGENLDVDDFEEQAKIGARLKESREYVGLLQEDVASALGIPRASVSALESGKRRVTALEIRRLARIYRKPVGWLLGDHEIEVGNAEPLFRATESLSAEDRDQVLRFAEFLAAAGKPGASGRAAGRGDPSSAQGEVDSEPEA